MSSVPHATRKAYICIAEIGTHKYLKELEDTYTWRQ